MPTKNKKSTEKKVVEKKTDVKDEKLMAILSYIGLLFIVPLILKPNDKFVKFHVKQGIILTIGWMVGSVLYPLLGLGFLVHIAVLVLSIMGIMNVSEGKTKDLPIVGDLAKKLNF